MQKMNTGYTTKTCHYIQRPLKLNHKVKGRLYIILSFLFHPQTYCAFQWEHDKKVRIMSKVSKKIIFSFPNSFVINTSKDFHYWWYCSWWRLSEYSAWERDYRLALRSFEDLSPTSCTIFSQNNLTNKSFNQNILMLKANISCDRLCWDIQKTFDELSFILHSWSKESSKCTLWTSPRHPF